MASCYVVVALLLAFAAVFIATGRADPVTFNSELELLAHRHLKMVVDAFAGGKAAYQSVNSRLVQGSFAYSNCADPSSEVATINSLDIKPDPLRLPGNITISLDAVVKSKFGKPLTAILVVEKKVFGVWIEVPCIHNVGSCTYDNACDELAKLVTKCPDVLVKQGINCRCPVSPTKVSLENYTVNVDAKIPSIADGDVKAKVTLMSGSTLITCLQLTLDLE